MRHGWNAVLDGSLRDSALEIVDAIARDLGRVATSTATPWELASRGLFFAYRADSGHGGQGDAKLAEDLVDRAVDAAVDAPGDASLYDGFAGVAWVVEHVSKLLDFYEEDRNAGVDDALAELVPEWRGTFDLIGGLVGIGVYALERGDRGKACLEEVVAALGRRAVRDASGCRWFTSPEWLSPQGLALSPAGHFDLGVAHGTPGVLSVLARASAEAAIDVGDLMDGAAGWTMAHTPGGWGRKWIGASPAPVVHSLWCYGNLGVAAALVAAAKGAGRTDWERTALDLAHSGARGGAETFKEPGICHGTSGIAHVYQRLYAETGDARCADEARRWFQETLAARGDRGVGGYEILDTRGGRLGAQDTGFLTGSAGLGLALLAACTPQEPGWDRLLLICPPAGARG